MLGISTWSSDVCASDLGDQASTTMKQNRMVVSTWRPTCPPRWPTTAPSSSSASASPVCRRSRRWSWTRTSTPRRAVSPGSASPAPGCPMRSEEHTSELQSLMRISYAVFCLKKNIFFLMIRRPTRSTSTDTLLPYTTLCRSRPSLENEETESYGCFDMASNLSSEVADDGSILELGIRLTGVPPVPAVELDPYLDAAARCFTRFGITRTRVPDVAAEVGVSRVTVYRQVGTVEDMARLLLARDMHRILTALPAALEGAVGPDTVVRLVERSEEHTSELQSL